MFFKLLCKVLWCWVKICEIKCVKVFLFFVIIGLIVYGFKWNIVEVILGGGLNEFGGILNKNVGL